MPPVVAGVGLLAAFGRRSGLIGSWLYDWFGIQLTFTTAAAVLAATFVSFPLAVLALEAGLRGLDERLEDAAATLGASRWYVLRRVTLPLMGPQIAAALVLSWSRALGEFGATITFAGNLQGRTQTLPLAVFEQLQTDTDAAFAISMLLILLAFAVILALRGRFLTMTLVVDVTARVVASRSGRRSRPRPVGRSRSSDRTAREVHARLDDRRPAASGRGDDRARGRGARRPRERRPRPARATADRRGLPKPAAVPAPVRDRERRVPAPSARRAQTGGARTRVRAPHASRSREARRCSPERSLGRRGPAGRARPGARSSSPGCCSWTNRSPPSTSAPGCAFEISSEKNSRASPGFVSSSRTIRSRRPCSPIGSCSWRTGGDADRHSGGHQDRAEVALRGGPGRGERLPRGSRATEEGAGKLATDEGESWSRGPMASNPAR